MATQSIKARVTQISIGAFLLTSTVILGGFVAFSETKRNLAWGEADRELRQNVPGQIDKLIPSFLLPEQSIGVELLLERMKKTEELSQADIIPDANHLPARYSDCSVQPAAIALCHSRDGKEAAIIAPISEGSHLFGYLLKSKPLASAFAALDILQLAALVAGILLVAFGLVYVFVARLLSREVPHALDRLVQWIDDDLSDRHSSISRLPFQEFEDLKAKIFEVMERHSAARDQAVIGQLTSGIMHDIKTPLQSLVTATELLELRPEGDPKRGKFLENLARVCSDNLPLIEEIVETTLDGSRKINLDCRRDDLADTIWDGLALNKNLAALRKVDVEADVESAPPIEHDPSQLVRVIHNLLKNAIEATSDRQGERRVVISSRPASNNRVVIRVEDSGPGLAGNPDKVFRAFKSSKIRGSGLGLLVSKKIVEAHGGTIRAARSERLGGACFEVQLPVEQCEEGVTV